MYRVDWTRQGKKDYVTAKKNGCSAKIIELLNVVRANPYDPNPPEHRFEELKGPLRGIYSRRIDYSNRFIYEVLSNDTNDKDPNGVPFEGIVNILRLWGHFP